MKLTKKEYIELIKILNLRINDIEESNETPKQKEIDLTKRLLNKIQNRNTEETTNWGLLAWLNRE